MNATADLFDVKVLTGIKVKMRDGVFLNVRLTRPNASGRFPAILEYTPYRRLISALPDYRDEKPSVVPYLAERGYVIVQFDVRGTGSSSGHSSHMYSEDERRDAVAMVEWAAKQDWCTGAVGLIGISYPAIATWQTAFQAPPELKAIVVRSGCDNVYTEFSNPGGSIRPWMFEAYGPMMNAFNFAPPDEGIVADASDAIWQERLSHSEPWTLSFIDNLLDGDYWQSRSLARDYARVKCPVLMIEGWADWYATAQLRAFQKLSVPRKIIVGPWGHYYPQDARAAPGPRMDTRLDYLSWFDHWLKGIENGVMQEPPVTVFVRSWQEPSLLCIEDTGTWRSESAWPPLHVEATDLYLASENGLSEQTQEGSETYRYRPSVGITAGRLGLGTTTPWGMPQDQRADDAFSVCYETPRWIESLELLGEPALVLYVSSTAEVAYFHARLCDVDEAGVSRLITHAGLLATHRHSHENPQALVPGEITKLVFPLKHCAYSVAKGHRLRLSIASAEFQNAWPTGMAAENTIYRGDLYPSKIQLPITFIDRSASKAVEIASSPIVQTPPQLKPVYCLQHDLVADQVTCILENSDTKALNRSRYRVCNRDPAATSIISSFHYEPSTQRQNMQIDATCETESDKSHFLHKSRVEIRVDDKIYFDKSWSRKVSRNLS